MDVLTLQLTATTILEGVLAASPSGQQVLRFSKMAGLQWETTIPPRRVTEFPACLGSNWAMSLHGGGQVGGAGNSA